MSIFFKLPKSSPLPETLDACKPSMIFLERIADQIILGNILAYSSDALNKSDIFIILILVWLITSSSISSTFTFSDLAEILNFSLWLKIGFTKD